MPTLRNAAMIIFRKIAITSYLNRESIQVNKINNCIKSHLIKINCSVKPFRHIFGAEDNIVLHSLVHFQVLGELTVKYVNCRHIFYKRSNTTVYWIIGKIISYVWSMNPGNAHRISLWLLQGNLQLFIHKI